MEFILAVLICGVICLNTMKQYHEGLEVAGDIHVA